MSQIVVDTDVASYLFNWYSLAQRISWVPGDMVLYPCLGPFPAGPPYPCGQGPYMTMNERTYLRYRRSAIARWPESARKRALLAAIDCREGQLDTEDKLRAEAEAGVSGWTWQRAQELP